MRVLAVVLSCLACAGHGRRVHLTSLGKPYQAGLSGRSGALDRKKSLASLLFLRGGVSSPDDVRGRNARKNHGTRGLRRGSTRRVRGSIAKTETENFRDHTGKSGFYDERRVARFRGALRTTRPAGGVRVAKSEIECFRDHTGKSNFDGMRGWSQSNTAPRTRTSSVEIVRPETENFRDHTGKSAFGEVRGGSRSRELPHISRATAEHENFKSKTERFRDHTGRTRFDGVRGWSQSNTPLGTRRSPVEIVKTRTENFRDHTGKSAFGDVRGRFRSREVSRARDVIVDMEQFKPETEKFRDYTGKTRFGDMRGGSRARGARRARRSTVEDEEVDDFIGAVLAAGA